MMEVKSPESRRVVGVAMDFPATDGAKTCSPPRVPPRLLCRLSKCQAASPSTVEEIEAKLRGADIRRKKFYENLSSKARLKPRSPSQSSSSEEDLGQRLEAKLQAAEQKRLSILAKAQIRLAKLDELRQAAKTTVEMRSKKERAELGSKVELRVQQAEENRMLILRAHRQRRATLKERTSQSLLRRMARESKYKERVRAAICQKRAAAEKKRLEFLEAEKKRAHARFLQVQKVAKSISHQRELERSKMKDKLENRLQKAKRQRAEYLLQRQRQNFSVCVNMSKTFVQDDLLSRKLARCWKQFLMKKKTTFDLAKAYDAMNINERDVKSMPFEQLALLIESVATLQNTKALLDRLELRYKLSRTVDTASRSPFSWGDIDHLLKRVASPNRRATPRKSIRNGIDAKKAATVRAAVKTPAKLSRYQVRVVLCAYMILSHPDAVFNGQGEREICLAKSAEIFVQEFEWLIKIILDGPIQRPNESDPALSRRLTFRSQLAAFDSAWCSYLNSFVVWKVKDAQLLEEDLVRAACQLEVSMIQTCKMTLEGESGSLTHDMKAIQKQVTEDQKLLRNKVLHLGGDAGIQRMECALSETRAKYLTRERGSPIGSPIAHTFSLSMSGSSACLSPVASISACPSSIDSIEKTSNMTETPERSSRVVRSLFKDNASSSQSKEVSLVVPRACIDGQFQYYGDNLEMENEVIVNELVHGRRHMPAESFSVGVENGIKAKVKETLEKAFWDGVMESMKHDKTKHHRLFELVKEVRDGICEMAPQSWKKEITGVIDLEIFSKLMNSGNLDMDYLGRILEFALVTLRKLSSPANENELKVVHKNFLEELREICQAGDGSNFVQVTVLIRGLRFVLEQMQALRREISKARMRIFEPFLKGAAGLEYLEKAFAKRYGPPTDDLTKLPLTKQWLESVRESRDQEWNEHKNNLSELTINHESATKQPLPSPLRSGGSLSVKISNQVASDTTITGTDDQHPECKGEKVDLMVRLGLLKLVGRISGLTQDELPETMKLNLSRLRAVQAQIQKIIVIATSILVLRQALLSEQLMTRLSILNGKVNDCIEQLGKLLDKSEDAGVEEIIEILSKVAKDYDSSVNAMKFQTRTDIMSRMLAKSLQAEDPVFARVSRVVHVAIRGGLLGGSGSHGKELTEKALRQVGAAALTDRTVKVASVLVEAATVSVVVHRPWYAHLMQKM